MEDEELIAGYVLHSETTTRDGTDADDFDAYEELDDIVRKDPERAWPIICEIVRRISADDILAYVAAGPLEDLLVLHSDSFIDRVESLAKSDAHFRRALSGVWGWSSIPDEVRQRIDAVLGDEPHL